MSHNESIQNTLTHVYTDHILYKTKQEQEQEQERILFLVCNHDIYRNSVFSYYNFELPSVERIPVLFY
jgi:hypothetical protein